MCAKIDAMGQPAAQLADSIQEDLACPQCQYNLRGLSGPIVQCPECGMQSDIAKMIANRWTAPWFKAPLYNVLAVPLAWIFLTSLGSFVGLGIASVNHSPSEALLWSLFLTILCVWIVLLNYVRRKFGSNEGLWLALLLHLVLLAYFLGIVGVVAMVANIISGFDRVRLLLAIHFVCLAFFVGLIVGGRYVERYVGQRCIRRYVRLKAAHATMAQ